MPEETFEMKIYENSAGYKKVNCPFCAYDSYYREHSNNPIRGVQSHIRTQAKNEALNHFINKGDVKESERKHLDYYAKHTSFTPQKVVENKRFFDDSLKVVE